DLHLRLAFHPQFVETAREEPRYMVDVEGGADRCYRFRLGNMCGWRQDGRAAKAVADQQIRRPACMPHRVGSRNQIGDAAAEAAVGEISAALAETGKVEAKHTITEGRQCLAEPNRRERALGTSE